MIQLDTRRTVMLGAFFAWLLLAGAAAAQQPFTPLLLDGETSLDVEAAPGLELGPESTLEFVVAALWEPDDGVEDYPAVLGRREPYEGDDPAGATAATQYSVHLTPDRKAIGLFDGTRFASVPFDFSDGQFHHVALVTSGGRTTVYVDREKIGVLEFGLGTTPGLPLHVGSSDGGSELFVGAVPSLRLWSAALTADQVAAIADVLGAPSEGAPTEKLAAYLDTEGEAPAFVVRSAPIATAPLPARPARKPSAEVETRGALDKLKAKLPTKANQQQKRIQKREVIRARIERFADPNVSTETVDYGGGIKFKRPAKSQRELARDMKKFEKLTGQIDDYNARLAAGPPDYRGGRFGRLRRQPAVAEAEAEPDEAAEEAPVRRPPVRLPPLATDDLPYAEALPRPGQLVGRPGGPRYRIDRRIGGGDFGDAYLVEEDGPDDGRPAEQRYAVMKQTKGVDEGDLDESNEQREALGYPRLTARQAIERTTVREVEMQNVAAEGDNPNVGPAERLGGNRIKQRFEGQSVKRVFSDGDWAGVPEPTKVAAFEVLARRTLEAVATLHDRQVVHRDLHPGNLTVDADGVVKVIDFGMAKRFDEPDLAVSMEYGTGRGGLFTPNELQGRAALNDPNLRSRGNFDVYSVGQMFDALRSGEAGRIARLLPPREPVLDERLGGQLIRNGQPVWQPRADPRLARLDEVIDSFRSADPARRPADARAALALLGDPVSSPEEIARAEAQLSTIARAKINRVLANEPEEIEFDEYMARPPAGSAGSAGSANSAGSGLSRPPSRPPPRLPAGEAAPPPAQ